MRADQIPSRYKDPRPLDGGGMSSTYQCKDSHLDRDVVIKALAAGTDARRLLDELLALQSIRSRHVVQLFDVVRDDKGNILAIVEEFIEGSDLTSASRPSNFIELVRLIYPIARGIADIHASGHVHRDIKRQNMKFDSEGCLKIFDFGLARSNPDEFSTLGVVGTPGYMAPELFEATTGGTFRFTEAIDTYAFAATAIALISGVLPSGLRRRPPDLPCAEADFSVILPDVPHQISAMMNACLSSNASDRPKMSDVANSLATYLLRDRHRATIVLKNKIYFLDQRNREVAISSAPHGSLEIFYDGLSFRARNITGDVFINNMRATAGIVLPGSCVIVIGPPDLGSRRTIVTVDVSHPEAVL